MGTASSRPVKGTPLEYERGEEPFFESQPTLTALRTLGKSERLVIYCGAGATIDRTGLDWTGLVRSVLPRRKHSGSLGEITQKRAESLLSTIRPEELASAITYASNLVRPPAKTNQKLADSLRRTLYAPHGWEHGNLAGNVVELAFLRAVLGRPTTIITSNYDTHLETEYENLRPFWEATGTRKLPLPGLQIYVGDKLLSSSSRASDGDRPPIVLVYLHGRIPSKGRAQGHLVFDENDYNSTRNAVIGQIESALTASDACLIVGTSLHDPPLIAALSSASGQSKRFVLLSQHLESVEAEGVSPESYFATIQSRNLNLGVITLFPDFHSQVAQFCDELSRYTYSTSPIKYGDLLSTWWRSWSHSHSSSAARTRTTKALQQSLKDIEDEFMIPLLAEEGLRLELWVRQQPGHLNRRLYQWAASDSIASSTSNLKFAEITIGSTIAAVQAFTEGRAVFRGRGDYPASPRNLAGLRRFNSFVSVPVRVLVKDDFLPVGVITLSSTSGRDESWFERLDETLRPILIEGLRLAGTKLLEIRR